MRAKRPADKSQLRLRQGLFTEAHLHAAQADLMRRVFGEANEPAKSRWWSTVYVDANERCVASIEARVLPFIIDDEERALTGVRRVAVAPEWRECGLGRDLITHALDWCGAQSREATLLFTSTPSLYARYGFLPVPQYAFVGASPESLPSEPSRQLDMSKDIELLASLLKRRTPVSSCVALNGAYDLVLDNLIAANDLTVAYASDIDAIIVFEKDAGGLTLVDIIAERIPPAAAILGSLNCRPKVLRTLFPPDRLGWTGQPQLDDAGLMSRGRLPPAMSRPFMLPPTAEF